MKKLLATFLSLLTIKGLISQSPKTKKDTRPNIFFIMADDHTSQAWGIYGGVLKDFVKNDNIKKLAREFVI